MSSSAPLPTEPGRRPPRGDARESGRTSTVSLYDYGLVGNQHTGALVSRFGSVDWACFPYFSSPSVFARLLDPERGGHQLVRPAEPFRSAQRYLPSSCVLETRFTLPHGRALVLTDFLVTDNPPSIEGAPMLVRLAHAEGGPVAVESEFVPRFSYGRYAGTFRARPDGVDVVHRSSRLAYRTPWRPRARAGTAHAGGTLRPSDPVAWKVAWGRPDGLDAPALGLLDRADRFWKGWVHSPGTPLHEVAGRWHRWIERSELTLQLLSNPASGAWIAAPTTSLPEWPGGPRNWDYRYVWVRDAAFAAAAMLGLDHLREVRSFLRWVLLQLHRSPGHHLQVIYPSEGGTSLRERTLSHLPGLWDSRPVRVGNLAAGQFQLDIYGELLDAALLLHQIEPAFVAERWPEVVRLADHVAAAWRRPDQGIWESRGPPRHYVYSKVMAWVALDRGERIALDLGQRARARSWARESRRIRAWVLSQGYDARRRSFRQAAGDSGTDAANLRIPMVGFLPYDDPRVVGTVDRIRRELANGPFVYRNEAKLSGEDPEGAFLPCSFWLVECLARGGRRELALRHWRRLLRAGSPLALFSEEYDPRHRQALGNYPQALTHIALLRAAAALGEAVSGRRIRVLEHPTPKSRPPPGQSRPGA
jgi:GH15 family glucan-1,4-alpha-glucosidase